MLPQYTKHLNKTYSERSLEKSYYFAIKYVASHRNMELQTGMLFLLLFGKLYFIMPIVKGAPKIGGN